MSSTYYELIDYGVEEKKCTVYSQQRHLIIDHATSEFRMKPEDQPDDFPDFPGIPGKYIVRQFNTYRVAT